MVLEATASFEQISSRAYEHPADRAATSALHGIPLMDTVVKRLTDLGHERRYRQMLMGNSVRIGPTQIPDVWTSYLGCVAALDLASTPDLYVTQTPLVNAMTVGAQTPLVVVNSSLVADYSPAEVRTVLAHECSHVLSEHYYYTTALVLLAEFIRGALPRSLLLGLPVRALYMALLEWSRAAELSADRASALVMGDPQETCRVLMRLAGGALPGMSLDVFVAQATEYHDEEDIFARHSRFWVELQQTHPFPVRRVRELIAWVQAGDFDRIRSGIYPRRGHEPPPSEEFAAATEHYRRRFAIFIDRTAGDVQRLSRQLSEWLNRRPADDPATDEEGFTV